MPPIPPETAADLQQSSARLHARGAVRRLNGKALRAIAEGMLADFTVISKDIAQASSRELLSIRVVKTIIGGHIRYEAQQ